MLDKGVGQERMLADRLERGIGRLAYWVSLAAVLLLCFVAGVAIAQAPPSSSAGLSILAVVVCAVLMVFLGYLRAKNAGQPGWLGFLTILGPFGILAILFLGIVRTAPVSVDGDPGG